LILSNYTYSTKIVNIRAGSRNWDFFNGEETTVFCNLYSKYINSTKTYFENSRKQLNEWKIKCGKLFAMLNDDEIYLPMKLRGNKKEYNADNFLFELKIENNHNAILTGDGGMGKTTTCMRLWEKYLNQNKLVFYIPLCDYEPTKDTIKNNITEIYSVKSDYERLIDREDIILLLDGFNEMKSEYNNNFFEELKYLNTKNNIQIVITSRSNVDDIETFCFIKLSFIPIKSDTIQKWLKSKNKETSISDELLIILSNPMLLKIYSININEPIIIKNRQEAELLDKPITKGEIIWNFLEYQIIKSTYQNIEDEGFSKILYRYLLPYIAYQIERENIFHFSIMDLEKYIFEFDKYFIQNRKYFNDLISCEESINKFLQNNYRTKVLLKLCEENLCIIKLQTKIGIEEKKYSFIHQYFRDIFSATYIKNEMFMQKKTVFTERLFAVHIYQILSEILQEHKQKIMDKSKLREYIECFRGNFGSKVQLGVFNIMQIIDYSKQGNFRNEDLSKLDLRMFSIVNKDYRDTNFSKSYLSRNMFFHQGHTDEVTDACYSPNGKYIVSASNDTTVKIWDSNQGMLLHKLEEHVSGVNCVRFSPNGKLIVSASNDTTLKIWDCNQGFLIHTLEGHESAVNGVSFSPCGKYIISASWDKTIKMWDSNQGTLICTFEGHNEKVNSVNYSPDGKYIVSASDDHTIKVWDSNKKILIYTLAKHDDRVNSANFSHNGKYIVSASWDGTIKIWNSNKGTLIDSFEEHISSVSNANYSYDDRYIVSTSWDHSIKIWNSDQGVLIHTLEGHKGTVNSACFSFDNKYIVSAGNDNAIIIWDTEQGTLIRSLEGHQETITSARLSPNGKYIISTSWDGIIKIWDFNQRTLICTLEKHDDAVNHAEFSHDGKYIVSASDDYTIKVWDFNQRKLIYTLKGHEDTVNCASFSYDDRYIISASCDKSIKIWDFEQGTLLKNFEGHKDNVCSTGFSPDGNYIVSASWDNTIKIWDSKQGKIIRNLEGHEDTVNCVNYSSDGKYIVSASGDNTIKVWDSNKGTLLYTLEGHETTVNSADFSQDGKFIISASWDNTIKIWDSTLGTLIHTLEGHETSVNCASFSYDGRYIISASGDNTIKIWDNYSKKLLQTIYQLSSAKILGSNFTKIKTDNLTEQDIEILRQNGALIN